MRRVGNGRDHEASNTKAANMTRTRRPVDKWTSRVMLGAMFLAALIFAAPWKVTLFLAFLFVSTLELLPRSPTRAKCIGWSLVGGFLVWLVWTFLPSNPGDYQPFQFAAERALLEQEYAVPDDQNAAATYARLVGESNPRDRVLRAWVKESCKVALRRPWQREEYPQLARWVDERAGMIEALRSLGTYSACRFPVEPTLQAMELSNPRRKAVRAWAYMLALAANLKAGEGDVDGALQLHALNLRIANHHLQQSDAVDYLLGLAVERLACNGISALASAGTPTPDQLAMMDALTATPSHDWAATSRRIMRFECLAGKNSLCGALYEVNSKGEVRYSRRGYMIDPNEGQGPDPKRMNGKMAASVMWVLLPKSPREFARRIDERYAQFSRIGQSDTAPESPGTAHRSRFRANHEYLLDMLMDQVEPGYHRIYELHLKGVATRRACRIILLLRRYKDESGRWPGSLEDVAAQGSPELWTDPLNGDSFVYRLDSQAFRLYSKGLNGADENGTGGDDLSFWPPRGRISGAEPNNADKP